MYDRLAELARRERKIVAEGRWDELVELQAERQALIDRLPADPPAEAESALGTALAQSTATQAALQRALAEVEAALGAVRRGRRVVSAYHQV